MKKIIIVLIGLFILVWMYNAYMHILKICENTDSIRARLDSVVIYSKAVEGTYKPEE